ncbi:MAG: NAD(P)H-dependent oxidoreductase subunit E [Candidatus Tectomicrobia bacterium]|nr:NAD(P)H-dependent oxidoreductase subunit E [Candidatus Tectomicrobia bacterium]
MSKNVVRINQRYAGEEPSTLVKLRQVKARGGRITNEDIERIALETYVPKAFVYGVATFYDDLKFTPHGRYHVRVCQGTACLASGCERTVRSLEQALGVKLGETSADGFATLEPVYCLGLCNVSPSVRVNDSVYGGMDEESVRALVDDLRAGGEPAESVPLALGCTAEQPIVLRNLLGGGAPRLAEARVRGVYDALLFALARMTPTQVIDQVVASQLRGRGGAGFPTGTKWKVCAAEPATPKYVCCNGDEGDPGAYIDKYLMEQDPHSILEGMALCGFAIGAERGYVYVRAEYPAAIRSLAQAVEDASAAGLLGRNIQGSGFNFEVSVVEGAGSYICGEETAMLRSIEGVRGMVSARPPFPTQQGLYGKPTVVNNVETLQTVPWILANGGGAYAAIGHNRSRGTKAISLNELFERPGLYEVPLGVTLRSIVEEIGGGLKEGRELKALQIGGPLGGIIPASLLDTRLGFEELDAVGGLLGHGGIVAFDTSMDMREVARHLFFFCEQESCGKCFPCRIGSRRGVELAEKFLAGQGRQGDLQLLDDLCDTMRLGSLCAHGGGIPAPIQSIMRHFREELLVS